MSDKTNLSGLATALSQNGVEIISTGGTYAALMEIGVDVTQVADVTGFPEMLDGRVKTLHPVIHAGLLAVRDNESHVDALEANDIPPIDLLIVNLYPFEQTVLAGKPFDTCVENIDVGGPTMIRSAAKNFKHVTVATDVSQYAYLISELEEHNGGTSLDLRRRFAAQAFSHLAAYDACVANRFASELGEIFPQRVLISATLKQRLRYGENPHQQAAFYKLNPTDDRQMLTRPCLSSAEQVQGKELSFNNIADTDAAFELVSEFDPKEGPVCCIIKHANPCGVAMGVTPQDAYLRALACDPTSAFGGIVAFNVTVDKHVAEEIYKLFTEVVIAPDATSEALAILSRKKNLRVLLTGGVPTTEETVSDTIASSSSAAASSSKTTTPVDAANGSSSAEADLPDMAAEFAVAESIASTLPTPSGNKNVNDTTGTESQSASSTAPPASTASTQNTTSTSPKKSDVTPMSRTFKSVSGGILIQTRDDGTRRLDELQVVSKRQPTDAELKDLLFAWRVCKHVKSNAIVYAKDLATVGTGAGQMSRVDASRIAAWKANEASSIAQEDVSRTVGSVVASDAFFPFADGLIAAADAGVTAVIQPGGSKRDEEVIAAADERQLAMVLTGMRHFRH